MEVDVVGGCSFYLLRAHPDAGMVGDYQSSLMGRDVMSLQLMRSRCPIKKPAQDKQDPGGLPCPMRADLGSVASGCESSPAYATTSAIARLFTSLGAT